MRNEPKPLTRDEAMHAYTMRDTLEASTGEVTINYTKRNGDKGSATGPVVFFNGREGMDTMAVTIDTRESKGRPTTVNLHLISEVIL